MFISIVKCMDGMYCCFGYNLLFLGELVNVSVRVNEK